MAKHRKGVPTSQLSEEYLNGATTTELAEKYGMTPAGVNGRLSRAGVNIRTARRRSILDQPKFIDRVAAMYQNGETINGIAVREKVGRSTIDRALRRAKVSFRRHGTRERTVALPSDPVALGYFAGLFDGEGNLQFRVKKYKNRRESAACRIAIYSTTPAVMGWLKNNFGGKVLWDYKRQERKGWKPCGSWSLYRAADVLAVLEWCLPALIIKRKDASKAIDFIRDKHHYDSPPVITQSS